QYDQLRAMGTGARFNGAGPGSQQGGFEDIFSGLFGQAGGRQGGFSDIFGGFGGGGQGFQYQQPPTKGANIKGSVTISFADYVRGITTHVSTSSVAAPEVRIPAGLTDGHTWSLSGNGE